MLVLGKSKMGIFWVPEHEHEHEHEHEIGRSRSRCGGGEGVDLNGAGVP
jgi:hypothetical protein